MTKVVVYFNVRLFSVNASRANQAVTQISQEEGVKTVRAFRSTNGKPRYAIEIECEEGAAEAVISRANSLINQATAQYSTFISDITMRAFQQLA